MNKDSWFLSQASVFLWKGERMTFSLQFEQSNAISFNYCGSIIPCMNNGLNACRILCRV